MTLHRLTPLAATAALLTLATPLWSADNELYDAPPPEDAAFIRWIDAGEAPDVLGIALTDQDERAFRPVSAAATDGARQGVFYTAALNDSGQIVVIEEPERADRSKVLLTLINLSGDGAALVLAANDAQVIPAIEADTAGGRAVNPVAASLSVLAADGRTLGTFDVQLRRGQNITFVARDGGAEMIENRFGPNIDS